MTYETERMAKALENMGFTIKEITTAPGNTGLVLASIETPRDNLEICWGTNGAAVITKPNGTRKWYYEKSIAQICRALQQTLDFYK